MTTTEIPPQEVGKVLQRSVLLSAATALSAAGQFILVWGIARTGGVDSLGIYGYVTSLVYLVEMMLFSGLEPLVMLQTTRDNKDLCRSVGTMLMGTTTLGLLATALLIILTKVLGHPKYVLVSTIIASAALIPDIIRGVSEWTIIALGKVRYVAFITIGAAAIQTLFAGIALLMGKTIVYVLSISTVMSVFIAGIYLWLFMRWVHPKHLEANVAESANWIRSLGPFLRMGVSGALSRRLDVPILTQLGGFGTAGIYTAAEKMVRPLILLRPAIFQAFFPIFVRTFDVKPELGLRMARTAARLLAITLSASALVTVIAANAIITLVFGTDFKPATLVLQLMVWGVPTFYAQTFAAGTLLADEQQKVAARIYTVNLAAEIGLSLVLVPLWGAIGMAIIHSTVKLLGVLQMWGALRRAWLVE